MCIGPVIFEELADMVTCLYLQKSGIRICNADNMPFDTGGSFCYFYFASDSSAFTSKARAGPQA